ncbi:MAG: hypothetical protein EZS28_011525 [Streblomastix strix]|uniref:Reverse transcriptase domain-containing protein n=1 Tax=Streblomastix strix TaxID=222440 RepID=A0A5J4WDE1_9EUKA|nr:MAG: hypothetical protein EZS28_011525 [Streblomastix strix]
MIGHLAAQKMFRLYPIDYSTYKFNDVQMYNPKKMGKINWKPKSDVVNLDALIRIINYLNEQQNQNITHRTHQKSNITSKSNKLQAVVDGLLEAEVYMDDIEDDIDPEYDDLQARAYDNGIIYQLPQEDYKSKLEDRLRNIRHNTQIILPDDWQQCSLDIEQLKNVPKSSLIRMNRLAASNQPGNAVDKMYNEVKGKKLLMPSQQTYEKLQNVYKYDDQQQPINIHYEQATISHMNKTFTLTVLKKAIMSLRRESAPGPSGWSPDTLKKMVRRSSIFLQSLHYMLQAMMANRFYPPSFFISNVIGLDKGAGKDPRPIEISEVWSRVMSKIINHIEGQRYKQFIPKSQKGTGDKRGGDSIGIMVAAAVDLSILNQGVDIQDDTIIVKTDINGAFPSVRWQQLAETLNRAQMSSMGLDYNIQRLQNQQIYHFEYKNAFLIKSNVGIAQGDPMSPNNFSVMTADLINKVCERKIEITQNQFSNKPSNSADSFPAVSAYMDDMVFIARGSQQMTDLLHLATSELEKVNMKFQWDKCVAIRARNGQIIGENGKITINEDNIIKFDEKMKILGIIISKDSKDRDDDFDKRAKDAIKVGDICSLLFNQNGLNCYRTCVATKLGRSVQTQEINPDNIRNFDNISQKQLLNILEVPPDAEHRLTSIPMRDGGLGVIRLSETRHAALQNTYYYVCSKEPMKTILQKAGLNDLTNKTDILTLASKLADGGVSALKTFLCRMIYDKEILKQEITEKKGQHQIWTQDMSKELAAFEDHLTSHARLEQLKTLRSHKGEISRGWLCAIGGNVQTRLNNSEMRHAVALWLMSNQDHLLFQQEIGIKCNDIIEKKEQSKNYSCVSCGRKWDKFHYTCCIVTTSVRTGRHHLCKHCIANQFRCIRNVTVVVEKGEFVQHKENIIQIIPDIIIMISMQSTQIPPFETQCLGGINERFLSHMIKFAIDITVVEENSNNSIGKSPKELANFTERQKIQKYIEFYNNFHYHVIPFCITSGGTLGNYAEAILNFLGDLQNIMKIKVTTAELKKELSVILIRSSAYQLELYEKSVRQIASNPRRLYIKQQIANAQKEKKEKDFKDMHKGDKINLSDISNNQLNQLTRNKHAKENIHTNRKNKSSITIQQFENIEICSSDEQGDDDYDHNNDQQFHEADKQQNSVRDQSQQNVNTIYTPYDKYLTSPESVINKSNNEILDQFYADIVSSRLSYQSQGNLTISLEEAEKNKDIVFQPNAVTDNITGFNGGLNTIPSLKYAVEPKQTQSLNLPDGFQQSNESINTQNKIKQSPPSGNLKQIISKPGLQELDKAKSNLLSHQQHNSHQSTLVSKPKIFEYDFGLQCLQQQQNQALSNDDISDNLLHPPRPFSMYDSNSQAANQLRNEITSRQINVFHQENTNYLNTQQVPTGQQLSEYTEMFKDCKDRSGSPIDLEQQQQQQPYFEAEVQAFNGFSQLNNINNTKYGQQLSKYTQMVKDGYSLTTPKQQQFSTLDPLAVHQSVQNVDNSADKSNQTDVSDQADQQNSSSIHDTAVLSVQQLTTLNPLAIHQSIQNVDNSADKSNQTDVSDQVGQQNSSSVLEHISNEHDTTTIIHKQIQHNVQLSPSTNQSSISQQVDSSVITQKIGTSLNNSIIIDDDNDDDDNNNNNDNNGDGNNQNKQKEPPIIQPQVTDEPDRTKMPTQFLQFMEQQVNKDQESTQKDIQADDETDSSYIKRPPKWYKNKEYSPADSPQITPEPQIETYNIDTITNLVGSPSKTEQLRVVRIQELDQSNISYAKQPSVRNTNDWNEQDGSIYSLMSPNPNDILNQIGKKRTYNKPKDKSGNDQTVVTKIRIISQDSDKNNNNNNNNQSSTASKQQIQQSLQQNSTVREGMDMDKDNDPAVDANADTEANVDNNGSVDPGDQQKN